MLISTPTEATPICTLSNTGHVCPRPTEAPIHLYMRVADAATYEIAEDKTTGQPTAVDYVGMTPDGSRVFFTSSEQLTSEETDGNTELYMWEAEKAENGEQPLSLISKPNGGADRQR